MDIPWDRIVKLGDVKFLDRHWFNCSIIFGTFCNYKCSYCWPTAHDAEYNFLLLSRYLSFIDNLTQQASDRGFTKFHWTLSGGEPSVYPDLITVIEKISKLPFESSLSMTTNLSRPLNWWSAFIQSSDGVRNRHITASYHDEYADEASFSDKCLLLMQAKINVIVNQVMDPRRFEEQYSRCSRLYEQGINVSLKPMSTTDGTKLVDGYTENMLNLMKSDMPICSVQNKRTFQMRLEDDSGESYFLDLAERMNSYNFNYFNDWGCSAGFQSVVLYRNEVRRAFTCNEEKLGTIDDFELFGSVRKCIVNKCVTSADTKIPKYKGVK